MKLKNNIKTFRELKGMTQETLAKDVGITINYLSLLENGRREPSIKLLKKMSKYLSVPVSVLILEVKETSRDPLDELLYELFKIATKPIRTA
jgi:transcriptional regulator with XRE-family HTH domain